MDAMKSSQSTKIESSFKTRRPSISIRTISSPASPDIPLSPVFSKFNHHNMLTPPSSPPRRAGSSSDLRVDYENLESLRSSTEGHRPFTYTTDSIIVCPFNVEHVLDLDAQPQLFGYGAWSKVFKATCHPTQVSQNGLMTPPVQYKEVLPLLVAIKTPARKDAVAILRNEARLLSKLRELDTSENFVATFHGIIEDQTSLVLTAHHLSLENYVRSCAKSQNSAGRETMTAPVIGDAYIWLDLANKLVTALDWLHNKALVVHGDIKLGNVLLKPVASISSEPIFDYSPLLIDFSSGQSLDTQEVTLNTLSAVTMEYTAPELLKSSVLRDPKSCATTASDVFSLAVTLLVAATGDPIVYTGCSTMQRQVLATSGWSVIGTVRSFSRRVPRHGVVDRVLARAVLKHDMGRINATSWKELVENMQKDQCARTKL